MMGFGFGGLGLFLMLVFWVVIIALAVWLLSNLFPRARGASSSPFVARHGDSSASPLEILKQRHARGEISTAEYEEMRRVLEV